MWLFLMLSLSTLIGYAGSKQYGRAYPDGLNGLPPDHAMRRKGRMMLKALYISMALHCTVVAFILKVAITEEPRILPAAGFMIIPLVFTWMSIDLVRNGENEKKPKEKK